MEANHSPKQIIWKGKRLVLNPGQLTCGAKQLAEWAGVPRGTVERVLKVFKSEEQIEVQAGNRFSLITINNWRDYQRSEEHNEEPMRNQRGASEEPVRTPKECKKERTTTTADEIFKILQIKNEDILPMIVDLLENNPDKDLVAVAMKVAGKYSGLPWGERWLVFVNWVATERDRPGTTKKETEEDLFRKYNKI